MATKSVKKNVTEEKTVTAADAKKTAAKPEAAKKTEVKKAEAEPAKKAEPKTAAEPAKKAEPKKTAAPRKTAAKKKEITTTVYVEYLGKQVDVKDSIPEIRQLWRKSGHKVRDIKDIKLYAKPEDSKIYFVVNDDFSGSVDL